jgi:hypothetical protein
MGPVYRRDYILRLIERFGLALRALRDRILKREVDAATVVAEIQDVAQQAGIDLELARRLDPASLSLWLAPGDDVDQPRLWLIAELLYLTGLQTSAEDPAAARGNFERALTLHSRLPADWRPSDGFVTSGERIAELRTRLADSNSATGHSG